MNPLLKAALTATPLLLVAACSHDAPRAESRAEATSAASPISAARPKAPITKFADANKDGKITREEAQVDPNLAREFDKYDKDKNGVLDRDEFARLTEEHTVVDTDADPVGDEGIRGFSSGLNRTGH